MIVLKIYTDLTPEQEEVFSTWCAEGIGMVEEAAYQDMRGDMGADKRYFVNNIIGEIVEDDGDTKNLP